MGGALVVRSRPGEGLRALLEAGGEMKVAGEGASGLEAIEAGYSLRWV